MFGVLWYFLQLVLFKNILEALGYSWLLFFGVAIVVVFLKLLVCALAEDDSNIRYKP